MFKKPFYNAILAAGYIVLIGTLMQNAQYVFGPHDNSLTPVIVLSLFVLSAAVMGFLFVGEPLMLFLDNHKKQAVAYFGQTVGYFAGITLIILIVSAIIGQL